MKNVKPLLVGLLAASSFAFSPLSQAQMSAQKLYVGVGFGQSKANDACNGASSVIIDPGSMFSISSFKKFLK